MSKEQAITQIESMSVEEILVQGLYVIAEEVDKVIKVIDVFFYKNEAKESFKQLHQFDSENSRTRLFSPQKPRVA